MNDYLKQIAKAILFFKVDGVSKVKFAKTIYFTHKGLIKIGKANKDELCYIRMPLGPVPVSFMELLNYQDIRVSRNNLGLTYDQEVFNLSESARESLAKGSPPDPEIKAILKDLEGISTSKLVEDSHKEPSWMKHKNGDEYCISEEDLARPLPKTKLISRILGQEPSQATEDQRLQARLLDGMIDDIVNETTALEYPEK